MNGQSQKKRESNLKVLKYCAQHNDDVKPFREAFQKRFGFDFLDEKKLPFMETGFSLSDCKKKMIESGAMREADDSSGFEQLLRAGVMQGINVGMYENVGTVWKELCTVFPSTKDTELVAPLTGIGFPNQVAKNGKYPEVGMYALDMSLQARLFGAIHPISKFLSDDDQTSQVQNGSRLMGEYMDLVIEVWMMGKLSSVAKATGAMTYANMTAMPSETRPSSEPASWPYATKASPFVGGGYNRPASYGALTQPNLQTAFSVLRTQVNQLGIRMAVNANTLLCSPATIFDATTIANSNFYTTNVYNASAPAAANSIGAPSAVNPLQGLFKPMQGNFIFDYDGSCTGLSKAWWLFDNSKPWFPLFMRSAPAVFVENPNAGASFENDVLRTKINARFNGDIVEPRFVYQGNNGSV